MCENSYTAKSSYGDEWTGSLYSGCGSFKPHCAMGGDYTEKSNCYTNSNCFYTGFINDDPYGSKSSYLKKSQYRQHARAQGLSQAQLFQGNPPCLNACDAFDDIFADMARPCNAPQFLEDPNNVIETTFNQVYDPRGPIACDEAGCTGCPRHNFQGMLSNRAYADLIRKSSALHVGIPVRGLPSAADNKPVQTYATY